MTRQVVPSTVKVKSIDIFSQPSAISCVPWSPQDVLP
jgi:hypothetical protein